MIPIASQGVLFWRLFLGQRNRRYRGNAAQSVIGLPHLESQQREGDR